MGMSSTSVRKCNICKGDNVQLMEGGEYHIGHTYEWKCMDCGMTYLHRERVERLDLDEVNKIRKERCDLPPLTELKSINVKDDYISDLHLLNYNKKLTNLMVDELNDNMVYDYEKNIHRKRIDLHPTEYSRFSYNPKNRLNKEREVV